MLKKNIKITFIALLSVLVFSAIVAFATQAATTETTTVGNDVFVGNNLNVNNRLGIGIGTTTPAEKLTLAGGNFLQTSLAPKIKGSVTDTKLCGSPSSVYVSGKYAYVTVGFNFTNQRPTPADTLTIIDISDPTSPTIVGSISDAQLNGPYSVYVSGQYAYVAAHIANALTIVDVSDPTSPAIVGSISDADKLARADSVYVSGKYAYVAAAGANALTIVDVSDPASPAIVGSITNAQLNGPTSVYVSGQYAYVADMGPTPKSGANALTIVDISNPASPAIVGSVTSTQLNDPSSVYVSGKYAYVAAADANALTIVDISDPTSPNIVGSITDNTKLDKDTSVYVSGKYAYVTSFAGETTTSTSTLTIVDISNPTSPKIVDSIADIQLEGASSVYVSGKYAYVPALSVLPTTTPPTSGVLNIVDISGIDVPTAQIGDLAASSIDVSENAIIGNNLYTQGGLNVGPGGLYVGNGEAAIYSSSSKAALTVQQAGSGYGAIINGGNVGIGTITPLSKLDVNGGLAIGSYAGNNPAPSNGAIISGNVGIGTTNPATSLDIAGNNAAIRIGESKTTPGCIEMYDHTTGSLTYVYVDNGSLVATTTKPNFCQSSSNLNPPHTPNQE